MGLVYSIIFIYIYTYMNGGFFFMVNVGRFTMEHMRYTLFVGGKKIEQLQADQPPPSSEISRDVLGNQKVVLSPHTPVV